MTRSNESIGAAVDLVDYLEAAADYECLDLMMGQRAQGLDEVDLSAICARYGVKRG
jgi:ribulose-5-phosphate 4-epimerase/fuculose-1-phosphate aldolase